MRAVPLTVDDYRPYGDVIEARADIKPTKANLGTAQRFNYVAELHDLRPGTAAPNLCVFRCNPMVQPGAARLDVKLLERHAHSTQAFIPMTGIERYLVVVSLGGDKPDVPTLKAFLATGGQGITYRPGVWHHPLVALDKIGEFACLVWEDDSAGDCDVVRLDAVVTVEFG